MRSLYSFVNNIYHITVLILLLLLSNHVNLILKLNQKKNTYLDKGWLFIGSFKVGGVPEITNNKVLSQFIYKPEYTTENLFI